MRTLNLYDKVLAREIDKDDPYKVTDSKDPRRKKTRLPLDFLDWDFEVMTLTLDEWWALAA